MTWKYYVRPELKGRVVVTDKSHFSAPIRSDVEYFIDGVIDMGSQSIEIPAGGLYLAGYNFDLSRLITSAPNHTLFTSPASGSGNLIGRDYSVEVTGLNSKVYGITGATGGEAIEFDKINYNNCTSLGEITDYRQALEVGSGRFGGTPELILSGAWSGMRISTSIVRGLSDLGALFKVGTNLTFDGRFITDINCDLPTTGALFDFSESNIVNDESLVVQGAFITRDGVVDPSDSGLTPNINQSSVKSNWDSNTGLANTNKYIKSVFTSEVVTPITSASTYFALLGTQVVDSAVHFSSPANGEFECLTGIGDYLITGDLTISGTANDVVDIRVAKSTDGGLTYPIELSHISRVINNLSGPRNVAFFPLNFIANISKGDRVRIEIENKTAANNLTCEIDSFFTISEI